MTDEKILPQDDSLKEQVPSRREDRIKLATENGGLKKCPSSFSDDDCMDWETIRSDNPFEILYLDYRSYNCITSTMINGNYTIIKNFWTDIASKAMSSPPVAKKYGGMDSIRKCSQILHKAYTELMPDENSLKKSFDKILKRKQESLRNFFDNALMQGEYNPSLVRQNALHHGQDTVGLDKGEVESFLIQVLKEKDFTPEQENATDPLAVNWYSPEKKLSLEKRKNDELREQLDSIIQGILSDGIFEPRELEPLKGKGKQLGYSEEQLLIEFENRMIQQGLSPDPDADVKTTDSINKRLSATWKTEGGHIEDSIRKFRIFLDGKLHGGIYTPNDYIKISEAATGVLKHDAVKLKETLVSYLKEMDFKPVSTFKTGNELTVEWKTNYAETPTTTKRYKAVLIGSVLVVVLSIALFFIFLKSGYGPPDAARIVALDTLSKGTDLSVSVSKIPKLEKVFDAAKELGDISPRYQDEVKMAEDTLQSALKNRDKNLLAYLGKVVELGRYTPEQISKAVSIIDGGDLTKREKIVTQLIKKHIDYLRNDNNTDPKKILSDFNNQFSNFAD